MTEIEARLLRNQIEIMNALNRVSPDRGLCRAIVNTERLLTETAFEELKSPPPRATLLSRLGLCPGHEAPRSALRH
jgi:hypothetical protein